MNIHVACVTTINILEWEYLSNAKGGRLIIHTYFRNVHIHVNGSWIVVSHTLDKTESVVTRHCLGHSLCCWTDQSTIQISLYYFTCP